MKSRIAALALLLTAFSVNAETTLKDGVFTKDQAARGKASFDTNCKSCHLPEFYEQKLASFNHAPLVEFFDLVAGTMPASAPGSLSNDEYADALAYIFSLLGYPAGDQELDYDDGTMEEIVIVTK